MDSLKILLKEDIWTIINGNTPEKRNFFSYVLSVLLNKKSILLNDVVELSKRLNNRYSQILSEVNEFIIQGNGEVLPALKRLDEEYRNKLLPILNEINRLRN